MENSLSFKSASNKEETAADKLAALHRILKNHHQFLTQLTADIAYFHDAIEKEKMKLSLLKSSLPSMMKESSGFSYKEMNIQQSKLVSPNYL